MIRTRPARVLLVALLALLPGGGSLAAPPDSTLGREEQITIERGGLTRVPILLEEFVPGAGATAKDATPVFDTVSRDLDYSDLFGVITIPRLGPEDVLPAGQSRALVRGEVVLSGGEILLRGSLLSLPDRGVIFSRDYRTRPDWYREAAHRFSDDIVLYLTGRPGIARTRIAFISNRTKNKEVHLVDYDGVGVRRVTQHNTISMSPDWSPDLREIAYVSYANGDPDLFVIDLSSGKSRTFISGPGVQSAPAFSPDGALIAFSHTEGRGSDIFVCGRNGKNRRRVTRATGISTSPSWAPDGRRLVFTSDRSGNPQLYVVDVDAGSPHRITFEGKWNDLADWSPDGDRIVYASMRDGAFRICLVEPTGLGEERQVTFGPGSDEHPQWAPDGRHVVISSTRGGGQGLYVVEVDSGRVRPLVVGGGNHSAGAWSDIPPR